MYRFIALALTLCSVLIRTTDCTSSYDQRQTGDFNVQIGLKNINIIALLKGGKEEYVDYDYAYDYSEMTIKPSSGTTTKPLHAINTTINTETQPIMNISTTILQEQMIKSSTSIPVETTEVLVNQTANYSIFTTPKFVADVTTTILPEFLNSVNVTTPPIINKCRRGFIPNNEGKCEYKVQGTTNALRRIVKLAQKIRVGKEYGGT